MLTRTLSLLILAGSLSPGAALAGPAQQVASQFNIGSTPLDVAILPGDRVVAALLDPAGSQLSWKDSGDFSAGPYTVALTATDARVLTGGTLDGLPVAFVGGEQLDVVRFDTSVLPVSVVSVDTTIGLGTEPSSIVGMVFIPELSSLFFADAARRQLRQVDFSGAEPRVDAVSGWPQDLGFVPSGLAKLAGQRLVMIGDDGGQPVVRRVDVQSLETPVIEGSGLLTAGFSGAAVAVTADEAGESFILDEAGGVWRIGATPPLGDDDDSALADDDDSAADDDDSAVDDDDSALAGGDAGDFFVTQLRAGGPTPARDIAWADDSGSTVVYTLGGNTVSAMDADGLDLGALSLAADGDALAASGDDYAYSVGTASGQMAVLASGPWVRRVGEDAVSLISSVDTVDISFEVTLGVVGTATCDYALSVSDTIDGVGLPIPSATGTANDGETVTVTLSGADLLEGTHRVFILCTDAQGDVGRASFPYYLGGLEAPSAFTATAGEGTVTLQWRDLDAATVDHYLVTFSRSSFDASSTPEDCNEDGLTCSPMEVLRSGDVAADDDDSVAADDDDTTGSASVGTITRQITGLTNGVTWYFAVATADGDDNVGPRTAVISATPSQLGGAAALAGDPGCSCGSSFTPAAASLLFLLPLFTRRRRSHP